MFVYLSVCLSDRLLLLNHLADLDKTWHGYSLNPQDDANAHQHVHQRTGIRAWAPMHLHQHVQATVNIMHV